MTRLPFSCVVFSLELFSLFFPKLDLLPHVDKSSHVSPMASKAKTREYLPPHNKPLQSSTNYNHFSHLGLTRDLASAPLGLLAGKPHHPVGVTGVTGFELTAAQETTKECLRHHSWWGLDPDTRALTDGSLSSLTLTVNSRLGIRHNAGTHAPGISST